MQRIKYNFFSSYIYIHNFYSTLFQCIEYIMSLYSRFQTNNISWGAVKVHDTFRNFSWKPPWQNFQRISEWAHEQQENPQKIHCKQKQSFPQWNYRHVLAHACSTAECFQNCSCWCEHVRLGTISCCVLRIWTANSGKSLDSILLTFSTVHVWKLRTYHLRLDCSVGSRGQLLLRGLFCYCQMSTGGVVIAHRSHQDFLSGSLEAGSNFKKWKTD